MTLAKVTKCICHDRTFQEIRAYAVDRNYSEIDELRRDRYCSCECRLCAPYIVMVLKTGRTEFEPGAPYRNSRNEDKI